MSKATLEQTPGVGAVWRDAPRFVRPERKPGYESVYHQRARIWPKREEWVQSLRAACRWLTEHSMVQCDELPDAQNPHGYHYASWRGAIREYDARRGHWHVFGPIWHTGQAAKALAMAGRVLDDSELVDAAKTAGHFVLRAQVNDPNDPDHGAIFAMENADGDVSATSCMLESLDGLIELSTVTGDDAWWDAALRCLQWTRNRLFLPDEGLFLDDFRLSTRTAESAPNTLLHGVPGRPLLEDGVFLKAAIRTGDPDLAYVFYTTAERLLAEENPAGNWINFPPCDAVAGLLHPRQAYWWGRPMVRAWQHSGEPRYLHCARRAAEWYRHAQRVDGGMFRVTDRDFVTSTFDCATSGILCGGLIWSDLIRAGEGDIYHEPLRRALGFGYRMQFGETANANLAGAILEKVLPPDRTDRPNFAVRDLGTIFYIQLVATMLDHNLYPALAASC